MAETGSGGGAGADAFDGESAARRRFAELIARPEVPLAEAALALAEEEYPRLDAGRHLAELDALAAAAVARAGGSDAASMLRALRAILFGEGGFRGNEEAYYDPRNSFLNEVLDRRLGIPITLSIVYLEVAKRAGFAAQGVRFPGHFLVKHVAAGGREIFVDAYRGGELLSAEDCAARHRARSPGRELDPRSLDAAPTPQILARLLHNLKRIYVDRRDDPRALWVVDRLLLLQPDDPVERRDRGLVEARLGGARAAAVDLEAYLAAVPDADDADEVRSVLRQLRAQPRFVN
jgi:regulator of sirC expression with transglutaminase-like and TPR domain